MINVQKHLQLLGHEVKDLASDFKGIVISICYDLYGCIQADVRPKKLDKDGKMQQGYWLDVNRLKTISKNPIMKQPSFCFENEPKKKIEGPANKPTKY